jgi:hypothetical protein
MSINKLIFILVLLSIKTADFPEFKTELTCGKNKPSKAKDCTPYGTGSGLLCCWVSDSSSSSNGACYLYPHNIKERFGVSGEKTFDTTVTIDKTKTNYFWSCGNKSSFININLIMTLFALFSL